MLDCSFKQLLWSRACLRWTRVVGGYMQSRNGKTSNKKRRKRLPIQLKGSGRLLPKCGLKVSRNQTPLSVIMPSHVRLNLHNIMLQNEWNVSAKLSSLISQRLAPQNSSKAPLMHCGFVSASNAGRRSGQVEIRKCSKPTLRIWNRNGRNLRLLRAFSLKPPGASFCVKRQWEVTKLLGLLLGFRTAIWLSRLPRATNLLQSEFDSKPRQDKSEVRNGPTFQSAPWGRRRAILAIHNTSQDVHRKSCGGWHPVGQVARFQAKN